MSNRDRLQQDNDDLMNIYNTAVNLPKYVNTSDANALAGDILSGRTAYVNSQKITGTMTNLGDIDITPNVASQLYNGGYYNSINVLPVDSTIDSNITQANIKAGVTILGIEGNLEPDKPDQSKSVNPSTSQQVVEPDIGYELSSVTVNAVTSSIDINIAPENIANGVEILGVTGTLSASEDLSNELEIQNSLIINLKAQVNSLSDIINNASMQTSEDLSNELNAQNLLIANLKTQVNSLSDIINNASIGGGGSSIPDGTKFGFSTFTDAPNIDTSNLSDASYMFYQCFNLVNVPNFDLSNCSDMSYMFGDCRNLTVIPNFDTSNVEMMNYTFYDCYTVTSVPNFNMNRMFSTAGLFQMCSGLNAVPNFNTSNVEHMSYMFAYCSSLTDIPEFNTSNLRSMSCFVQGCNSLSNAAIQNIINMCLNATNYDGRKTLDRWEWDSPLYDTIFDSSYYENRWMELSAAGWSY